MNGEKILDEWMSEAEAAAEIGKTVRTLRQWRRRRTGPPYAHFGRSVKYHRPTFVEYFKSIQVMPARTRIPLRRATR
jgi:hypothetical protein